MGVVAKKLSPRVLPESQRQAEAPDPDASRPASGEWLAWRRQLARNPLVRLLRLARRLPVTIDATLIVRGLALPVVVRDISRYGVRLDGVAGLERDQAVGLELGDGRRIEAVVRWSIDDRAGVELVEPLAGLGPFLAASDAPEAVGGQSGVPDGVPACSAVPGRGSPVAANAMIMGACRKQGFAWLADEQDLFPHKTP